MGRERTLRDARLTFETRQQLREARSERNKILFPLVPDRDLGAQHSGKTHCVNGHAYTDENLRIDGRGHLVCRTCQRIARQKHRGKLKEAA